MCLYKNNDLVEGDSAFCQPEETLLTEAWAEVYSVSRGLTKMHGHPQRGRNLFYYTEQTIQKNAMTLNIYLISLTGSITI